MSKTKRRPTPDFIYVNDDGYLVVNFHAGQKRALNSKKRFVVVTSGTQGGKSSAVPPLMHKEIQRVGQGDYLVATPTYSLFRKKLKGELLRYFEVFLKAGKWNEGSMEFLFTPEWEKEIFGERYDPYKQTRIIVGYAAKPESLESATVLAAFLDEAGQSDFKLGSWYAILRRLSLAASIDETEEGNEYLEGVPAGRVFITTTPYNLGWLYSKLWKPLYDLHIQGIEHDEIEVINFRSIDNPAFSLKEWNRAKADLPEWMFSMMYEGVFTRPAGLIYSNWSEEFMVDRFPIPKTWTRYMGIDFGGVNTAALMYAQDPHTKKFFLYRTYHAGGRTAAQHVEELLNEGIPFGGVWGGAGSEDQWRNEFSQAGLPIAQPPIRDVEVGIGRVFAAHAKKALYVFRDLEEYIEEKRTYSRKVDELGNPTIEIANKGTYHLMDAERYFAVGIGDFSPNNAKTGQEKPKKKQIVMTSSRRNRKYVDRSIPFALRD